MTIFSCENQSLFRFAPFFFHARSHSRFTKNVDRFFQVAFSQDKRFFALPHADAGALAQFFDHIGSNLFHSSPHYSLSSSDDSSSPSSSSSGGDLSPFATDAVISFFLSIMACIRDWRTILMLLRASSLHAITYSMGPGSQFVAARAMTGMPSVFASATAMCSRLGSTTMSKPGGLRIERMPERFRSSFT